MNPQIAIPVIVLLVLALSNIPIWACVVSASLTYFMFMDPMLPTKIVVQRILAMCDNQTYLAIPFFITGGALMNYSGISRRLMDFADVLVGHMTGGLAQVNVVLSCLMGGISGSSAADAALESKILVPEMIRHGYAKDFSAAVTLASSMITPIIPPGMGLIVFAFMTGTSVGRLLAAGYVPGFMLTVSFMIFVHFKSKKAGYMGTRDKMCSIGQIMKQFWVSIWALLMPLGIIMGLRFGLFTADEAGAFCAVYAIFVGVFVYKEFKFKEHFWPAMEESIQGTATVMMLICGANAFSYYLTYMRIPVKLTEAIMGMNLNATSFMLLTILILVILGMVMDSSTPLVILAPMMAPIAAGMGIDPVHYGLIFCFTISLGNMTPPFGIVLYQVAGLLQIPLGRLSKLIIPYCFVMVGVLLVCAFIPQLVLFVPNLIYG